MHIHALNSDLHKTNPCEKLNLFRKMVPQEPTLEQTRNTKISISK